MKLNSVSREHNARLELQLPRRLGPAGLALLMASCGSVTGLEQSEAEVRSGPVLVRGMVVAQVGQMSITGFEMTTVSAAALPFTAAAPFTPRSCTEERVGEHCVRKTCREGALPFADFSFAGMGRLTLMSPGVVREIPAPDYFWSEPALVYAPLTEVTLAATGDRAAGVPDFDVELRINANIDRITAPPLARVCLPDEGCLWADVPTWPRSGDVTVEWEGNATGVRTSVVARITQDENDLFALMVEESPQHAYLECSFDSTAGRGTIGAAELSAMPAGPAYFSLDPRTFSRTKIEDGYVIRVLNSPGSSTQTTSPINLN